MIIDVVENNGVSSNFYRDLKKKSFDRVIKSLEFSKKI